MISGGGCCHRDERYATPRACGATRSDRRRALLATVVRRPASGHLRTPPTVGVPSPARARADAGNEGGCSSATQPALDFKMITGEVDGSRAVTANMFWQQVNASINATEILDVQGFSHQSAAVFAE